jgi:hypothetical protein
MTPLVFILTVALGTYSLMSLATILTLSTKYKYYKLTYQLLYSGNYVFSTECSTYVGFSKPNQNNLWSWSTDEILYFKQDGSIKLIDGYIHNNLMILFDPYTLYWYFKIEKLIRNQLRLNLIRVR